MEVHGPRCRLLGRGRRLGRPDAVRGRSGLDFLGRGRAVSGRVRDHRCGIRACGRRERARFRSGRAARMSGGRSGRRSGRVDVRRSRRLDGVIGLDALVPACDRLPDHRRVLADSHRQSLSVDAFDRNLGRGCHHRHSASHRVRLRHLLSARRCRALPLADPEHAVAGGLRVLRSRCAVRAGAGGRTDRAAQSVQVRASTIRRSGSRGCRHPGGHGRATGSRSARRAVGLGDRAVLCVGHIPGRRQDGLLPRNAAQAGFGARERGTNGCRYRTGEPQAASGAARHDARHARRIGRLHARGRHRPFRSDQRDVRVQRGRQRAPRDRPSPRRLGAVRRSGGAAGRRSVRRGDASDAGQDRYFRHGTSAPIRGQQNDVRARHQRRPRRGGRDSGVRGVFGGVRDERRRRRGDVAASSCGVDVREGRPCSHRSVRARHGPKPTRSDATVGRARHGDP